MPHHTTKELPKGVKQNLPQHAQEIYEEAHDNALKEYGDPQKRSVAFMIVDFKAFGQRDGFQKFPKRIIR